MVLCSAPGRLAGLLPSIGVVQQPEKRFGHFLRITRGNRLDPAVALDELSKTDTRPVTVEVDRGPLMLELQ